MAQNLHDYWVNQGTPIANPPPLNVVSVSTVGPAPKVSETMEVQFASWSLTRSTSIQSAEMRAVGDLWSVEVYPRGLTIQPYGETTGSEHVAVYLRYRGVETYRAPLEASVLITIVNQLDSTRSKGKKWFAWEFSRCDETPGDACPPLPGGWHDADKYMGAALFYPNLIQQSVLEDESTGFKVDDRVVLRFSVTTHGEIRSTVNAAASPFMPPSTTTADMAIVFSSGYMSDITISCEERSFRCHRCVLGGRSEFFRGLFASSMRDADSSTHTVIDVEPDVLEQLLLWIYTGEVAEAALQAEDMLEHLLMAAIQYACGGLKLLCEAKLCGGLTVENASTRLVLSEQAEADELKESCLDFINQNMSAVIETEGWKDVQAAGVGLVQEVLSAATANVFGKIGNNQRRQEEGQLQLGHPETSMQRTVDEYISLRMARLKALLVERGLNPEGRRRQLAERLEAAGRQVPTSRTASPVPPAHATECAGSSSSSYSSGPGRA